MRDLTGHVHHPTVAHSQDLVGLAEQPAGTDAVCVVSWELLFAAGAAVPPGLGQVGQLSTQRFIRPPSRPARLDGCRRRRRSRSCDEEDLPSAPDMKQRSENPERRRSPAGGCKEARPDCGSELGCRPPGTFRLHGETQRRETQPGNFRRTPPLTARTRRYNAKPDFGGAWKINRDGLLTFDSHGISTNLRRFIFPWEFPITNQTFHVAVQSENVLFAARDPENSVQVVFILT